MGYLWGGRINKKTKTLHDLFVELEFGLEGNKVAKDFNQQERGGKNNFQFYLRNFFEDSKEGPDSARFL